MKEEVLNCFCYNCITIGWWNLRFIYQNISWINVGSFYFFFFFALIRASKKGRNWNSNLRWVWVKVCIDWWLTIPGLFIFWKGVWGPLLQITPLPWFRSPINSGLQGPHIQHLNITYDPLKQSSWWDGWGTQLSWITHTNKQKAKCCVIMVMLRQVIQFKQQQQQQ